MNKKIEELLINAVASGWCVVNIDNEFQFNGDKFKIDEKIRQYSVSGKPAKVNGSWNNWTNDANMDSIYCIDTGEELRFFDQNLREVNDELVRLML